jgi:hypothetical protein
MMGSRRVTTFVRERRGIRRRRAVRRETARDAGRPAAIQVRARDGG